MYFHDIADWLEETPNRELMVAPRFLAGTVEQHWAIEPLATQHGWVRDNDVFGGDYLASPCRRVHVVFRPQHGVDFTWQISASTRPLSGLVWQAEFQPTVPDEIVRAFTDALARDIASGDDRFLTAPTVPGIAYGPLLAAGWEPTVANRPGLLGAGPREITAKDNLARLTHQGHLPDDTWMTANHAPHWELRGGHPHWGPTWHATFAGAIPTHLLAAITAELADPRPIRRRACQIPTQNAQFLRVMPAEWLPSVDTDDAVRARSTVLPSPKPVVTGPTVAFPHTQPRPAIAAPSHR